MCGIVGIVSQTASVEETLLSRMVATIAHRGPNHAAVRTEHQPELSVGLGYCRLSIIDLSAAGNQPMTNENDDVWIVYNGELYNHVDLRRELEAEGYRYRSRSDTETVLHAYEQWGTEAFARFNGMFAFALYDRRSASVILARDKRAIKPLYYFWDGRTLAFASELKALLKTGLLHTDIDPTALWLFLCLGYVPSPYSITARVHKLEPGHYLQLQHGNLNLRRFATDRICTEAGCDKVEAAQRVRQGLEDAVQRQLMSDVPVGVFLSGGLDSTIVATLARRYHSGPLHTFSIGYANGHHAAQMDPRYNNDLLWARRTAEALRTIHHEVIVQNDAALMDLFPQVVFQLDEPMVEPVFVSTHFLSQLARQNGVPVILTGDGGDELFGGYDRYFIAQRLSRYEQLPGLEWALPLVGKLARNRPIAHSALALQQLLRNPSAAAKYLYLSCIHRPDQALQLLAPDIAAEVDREALVRLVDTALGREASFVDQVARADLIYWVGEHFNPRLDRISMLHSVEARVPFQDDVVVDTALSLPMQDKSTPRARKHLLKRAFADLIPEPIRSHPKRAFQAPGAAWLEGGLAATTDQLTDGQWDRAGLFNSQLVRHHVLNHGKDAPGNIFAVWALLIAELWVRQYLNSDTIGIHA